MWDGYVHTAIFKMDNQQGPTLWHTKLYSVLPVWIAREGGFGEEWIHVCVWLSPFAVHLKLSQHC